MSALNITVGRSKGRPQILDEAFLKNLQVGASVGVTLQFLVAVELVLVGPS